MVPKKLAAVLAALMLMLALGACSSDSSEKDSTSSDKTTSDSSKSEDKSDEKGEKQTAPKSNVDRSTLPYADEFPADFPLEDISFPPNGEFGYAELVDEDVWNVLISYIPRADHDAWVDEMANKFSKSEPEQLKFMGAVPSGQWYSIWGSADESDAGVTVAYRISVMD